MNPTKEKILQAAQDNPEAAKTLKSLFPDYFKGSLVSSNFSTLKDKGIKGFFEEVISNTGGNLSNIFGTCSDFDSDYPYSNKGIIVSGGYTSKKFNSPNDKMIRFKLVDVEEDGMDPWQILVPDVEE